MFTHLVVSTVGIDIVTESFTFDDETVTLSIFDTAGQERYFAMSRSYFRDADVILMLYSCENRKSFNRIEEFWLLEAFQYLDEQEVKQFLVCTKCDLVKERQVR